MPCWVRPVNSSFGRALQNADLCWDPPWNSRSLLGPFLDPPPFLMPFPKTLFPPFLSVGRPGCRGGARKRLQLTSRREQKTPMLRRPSTAFRIVHSLQRRQNAQAQSSPPSIDKKRLMTGHRACAWHLLVRGCSCIAVGLRQSHIASFQAPKT